MVVNRKEIYRYLGYPGSGATPDEGTVNLVEEVLYALEKLITPKNITMELPLEIREDTIIIGGETGFTVHSKGLLKSLKGCEKVLLFYATLGPGPDFLQKRSAVSSLAKAAAVQAAGAAMTESYCNEVNKQLEERYKGEFFLRPRFSPGYGDFSLTHQKDFFRIMDITGKLGVNLGDSLLMTPTKSVTAVIGLTKDKNGCNISGCAGCDKLDCVFRLEG